MSPKITVYTTPNCGACIATKSSMRRNDLEYEEVDLSTNPEALAMVKRMGHTKAPVIVRTDPATDRVLDHWDGYRLDKVRAAATLEHAPSGSSPPWPPLGQQVSGPRSTLEADSDQTRPDLTVIPSALSHEVLRQGELDRPTIDMA